MKPTMVQMQSMLFLITAFYTKVDSFSRLYSTKLLLTRLNDKVASSSTSSRIRPSPQMIPIPFDFYEEGEESTNDNHDEYDGLFDGQVFGLSDSISPTVPVMSFEGEFDSRSSSLIELVFESPYDSPAAVRAKNVLRSVTLFVLLMATTFTASYYVFPGSFQHYTVIGQFHPRYSTSLPSFSSFEQAEYSESGGVTWGDFDEPPMSKTTVTINDGLAFNNKEIYAVNLQPLEDL
jgi:hypothetical protein